MLNMANLNKLKMMDIYLQALDFDVLYFLWFKAS